jgi:hypothetical protein
VINTPDVDDITNPSIGRRGGYTLVATNGTNLTGNEGYFTQTMGGGTELLVRISTVIKRSISLPSRNYLPNCYDEAPQ